MTSDHPPLFPCRRLGGYAATVATRWPTTTRRLTAAAILAVVSAATSARAEELIVPGSGNPEHVLSLVADAYNRQQTAHRVLVPSTTGTAGALRDVEAGTATLGRVGRSLTEAERARGLVYVPIGFDPVTFVAGADVTVTSLTTQQVLDIYAGRITNWQQLGGQQAPIRAIGREMTDASRRAIARVMKPFETIPFHAGVKIVHLDSQMLELLDRFPTSLGFLNQSALRPSRTRLVELSLDGMKAASDAVIEGKYGLWVEMGLIHKSGRLSPAARDFIDFLASDQAKTIMTAQGLLVGAKSAGVVR